MKFTGIGVFSSIVLVAPVSAQNAVKTPTLVAPIEAPADLTEAEQAMFKKCMTMTPGQRAQSSKCSKVMVKAGKGDPAKQRGSSASPMKDSKLREF